MKVLQFVPSLNSFDGGTTTYMQQLAPVMGRMCELHVCALGDTNDYVPLANCSVHSIPVSLLHVRQMKREWMALLDVIRPDIVHVNCCWMPQCALVPRWTNEWRKSLNPRLLLTPHPSSLFPRLLLTPHGMLEPWIMARNHWTKKVPAIWLYQRSAVKNVDMVVATAESEREHLLQLGWNKNIGLVKNGIDVKGIAVKTEWKEPRRMLFMSRIHPKKGLEMLFEAMTGFQDLQLDIAGNGEQQYVESLKDMAGRMNLTERVNFLGAVYDDRKWELIRQADVVVLPSYSENYGLIVAEALASGTPVMTTTGTPWQPIAENECGWWVDPSVSAIAGALDRIVKMDAKAMTEYGNRARMLAENECEITDKIEELYRLYQSV